jgi:single-strand DNA-binding protein
MRSVSNSTRMFYNLTKYNNQMNLNKAIIIGRLVRDPELKALPSGQNVVSFSLATSRVWKDKAGAKKEDTEFHNMVAFGKQADTIAQYVKKGALLMVEGRLQTRSWEADNVKKYRTEIIVENFQFGPKAANAGTSTAKKEDTKESELDEQFPDEEAGAPGNGEIPF